MGKKSTGIMDMVGPSDIRTDGGFWNVFGNTDRHIVARKVVITQQKQGGWVPFTWEQYLQLCDHGSSGDLEHIEWFADNGYMTYASMARGQELHYKITGKFIAALYDYVEKGGENG